MSANVAKEPITGDRQGTQVKSIEASRGWFFPEVKLASWDPEDKKQWKNGGSAIAHRNLLVSIPNLFCAFGVWLVWSVITSKIQLMHDADPTVYPFQDWGSPKGSDYNVLLYTLPAVAGLSGGTMRIVNSFMTQIVGGRNVVANSSVMLTIAMIWTAIALSSKTTPFNTLLIGAWLSGTGGGAFASSMSNMSTLFPKSQQGYCLGFNGGFGNFGVSMSQLLVPMIINRSFGREPLTEFVNDWPNHAGWFWWPICFLSAIAAFIWMSNNPDHGNHVGKNPKLWNTLYYYYFEGLGLFVAVISIVIMVSSRSVSFFVTPGGRVLHNCLQVVIASILMHAAIYCFSPRDTRPILREQAKMFEDKHTYIMTFLYTMCFGSFIGFSGAFPKLITDLFGYLTASGCFFDDGAGGKIFASGGTQFDCVGNGGVWGSQTVTNPNAPNVFMYSWLGAGVGSLIRPFGGVLADRHGGAKVTGILIWWCTLATLGLAVIVQQTRELQQPEHNFGLFVFFFLNVFFCVGAMNGTTFRSIGVLFDAKLAGPVLGWSSAIASYGAFVIPAMFGVALEAGRPELTLYCLAVYYAFCGCLNYWYYTRSGAERPGV